jgi:DNA-binding NarL/FixJ family response regulator
MEPIKLAIIDSEEVFRQGIAKLLEEQKGIQVVLQDHPGDHAASKCNSIKPDVVLLDSHAAECDPLQLLKDIKQNSPETKVAILSRSDSAKKPLDFMKAGAQAVLAKNISTADLIKSLELISSGRIIISPVFAESFLQGLGSRGNEPHGSDPPPKPLSDREMEIARLISQGATNKEIAEKLFITENTVKVHVKNVLSKLDLKNRQQLAVYAVMNEWISANPDSQPAQQGGS